MVLILTESTLWSEWTTKAEEHSLSQKLNLLKPASGFSSKYLFLSLSLQSPIWEVKGIGHITNFTPAEMGWEEKLSWSEQKLPKLKVGHPFSKSKTFCSNHRHVNYRYRSTYNHYCLKLQHQWKKWRTVLALTTIIRPYSEWTGNRDSLFKKSK